jgi:hypothetical protein
VITELLWWQQPSVVAFHVVVLTVISQLYRSSIDQYENLWVKQLIHHTLTFVLLFMRTCVPRVLSMINYIFSQQLQLSNNKKRLFLLQLLVTRQYVSGFPLGCCDRNTMCVIEITATLNLVFVEWQFLHWASEQASKSTGQEYNLQISTFAD